MEQMSKNEQKQTFTELVDIVYLNSENTKFYTTPGGCTALEANIREISENLEEENSEPFWHDLGRVWFHRAFPFDAPDEFISVLDKDGKEYGIIRHIDDVGEEAAALIRASLERKYYAPEILSIENVKERFGYSYWDVTTDKGKLSFTLRDTFRSIVKVDERRIFITDIDGNRFNISDIEALDRHSYRRIELYL